MTSGMLASGSRVRLRTSGGSATVGRLLGGGGQGEVYEAVLDGDPFALKWYLPHYLRSDPRLRERLEVAIERGPPSERFLWPLEIAEAPGEPSFGYLMRLRLKGFREVKDLLADPPRRLDLSLRARATAGLQLADAFLRLHAKGLCYHDINLGNVFVDPPSGEVCVCDNDNVDQNGIRGTIGGVLPFMAPEVARDEAAPNRDTDLHSLAVLLFHLLLGHHPLEGRREFELLCPDGEDFKQLYGHRPVFMFDPADRSNGPVAGVHDRVEALWAAMPDSLRTLFQRAFGPGLHSPGKRVVENEWRSALSQLRDRIFYCVSCGVENVYDLERIKARGGQLDGCRVCREQPRLPPRLRIGHGVVLLPHDGRLYPHHLDPHRRFDFAAPAAEVSLHPSQPGLWGLTNRSDATWSVTMPDGKTALIPPGRTVRITNGMTVAFGAQSGEVRT